MVGTVSEFILSSLAELSAADKFKLLATLVPVLKEQEKEMEKRRKVAEKIFLEKGYHFGSKNYEGSDILRNAVRVRLADWTAGVSIKETIPVPEGWFVVEKVLRDLKDAELCEKSGGLILLKTEDLFRLSYGTFYVDIPFEERVKIANAIDRGLYYKNDELGILVRSDGNVYVFIGKEDRVYVKEPYKLMIFLRVGL